MIYMKRHYWKLHYIVLCSLTPQTYPNYPLSHHLSSFPLTVENGGKPRLHHNSIFLMFAAMLAAVCKLSFHKCHSSKKNTPISLPPKHIIWISRWSFGTK